MKKLEIISFVSGFCLLSFELVASRILAPTIGSSMYVWTSVIGVIIAALSAGYYYGGKLADERKRESDMAWLLIASGAAIALALLMYPAFLQSIAVSIEDARLQAVIASTVLFAPASFLLGMLSPYLAKLNVTNLEHSGSAIASLSALNSIGGIAGTFITGFFIFGYVGSREALVLLVGALLITSWLAVPRFERKARAGANGVVAALLALSFIPTSQALASIDTANAHYDVIEMDYKGKSIRGLQTGPSGIQSAIYTDGSNELVFWYTKEIARIVEAHSAARNKAPESILVLGGGAFTQPQNFAEKYPGASIDVVEIDPELEAISKQYFNYQEPSNVELIFQDARSYVNQSDKRYDVIVVDVYGDSNIPFSLITKEYGQAVAERLEDDGLLVANVIAGTTGPCKKIFDAVTATYQQQLPFGFYSYQSMNQELVRGNTIMGFGRNQDAIEGTRQLSTQNTTPLYSDNYAPTERLYETCKTV